MIGYLKGTILAKKERYLILLAGESIGYRIHVTITMLENTALNQEIALYIYTYAREDALELYGFETIEEIDFFERLISIAGVGPRSAMGVLSIAPLGDIKKAIIHGDPALLQKVSSIGKKTAERIIVELKEKISVTDKEETTGLNITEHIQLTEALASLGYRDYDIRKAIHQLSPEKKDLAEKIKEALRILSGARS